MNQVNYLGKSLISHKQTIWDDNIVKYRGLSSIEKSPLERDKSHLCACMIPNRYFASPAALVWPGLPLAPDAPDPLYFSFNHSFISFSQDNKGTIPVSCGAHAVAPHWLLTLPKEQSAIVKLPLNFLHLIKPEEERNLGPVPTLRLPCPKWRASWFCIISMPWPRLVMAFSNTSFLFYYRALLTVHSFLTDGFIYSALEDSEVTGHIDTAINCTTYISMYAWLCSFTGRYLQELFRLLTDINYMLTNVSSLS